jgi:hypothetical protein
MDIAFMEYATNTKEEKDGKIDEQLNSSLLESDDHNRDRLCTVWCSLSLFLRRILFSRCKKIEKNKGESLFELRCKDGEFILISQPWVAEALGLSQEHIFEASRPEMIIPELTKIIGIIDSAPK